MRSLMSVVSTVALLQQADPIAEAAQLIGHLGLRVDPRAERAELLVQQLDGLGAAGELLEAGRQLVVGLRRGCGQLGHLLDATRQRGQLGGHVQRNAYAGVGGRDGLARLDLDDALVQLVDLAADRVVGLEADLDALDLLDDLGGVALRSVGQDHRGRGDRAEPVFEHDLGLLAGLETLFQLVDLVLEQDRVSCIDRWLLLEQSHDEPRWSAVCVRPTVSLAPSPIREPAGPGRSSSPAARQRPTAVR